MKKSDAGAAIIIGASGGIGAAIMRALETRGFDGPIVALSRSGDGLDITDEAAIAAAAETLKARGLSPTLIFDASGALEAAGKRPEKSFTELSPEAMAAAFAINASGPALLYKHFFALAPRRGRCVFATLSARVGSIGDNRLGGWISYRASKAALNQIIRCAAIEARRRNPESVVVALHPGTIETPLTQTYAGGRYTATADEAAEQLLGVLERLTPEQSGGFFDYAGEEIVW
ncbi:MAG: SDR family NAD(P)-dependent oxidoreductase [Pseudomonadota bacterium]